MNFFAAGNLFENPLVLVAIVVVWVIVTWLKNQRQSAEADKPPDLVQRPPSPSTEGQSQRPPDLQEILRQLLGGEPPPPAPPPPHIPHALRDGEPSPSWSDEEQEGRWTGETQEAHDGARPWAQAASEPPLLPTALAQASANRLQAAERQVEEARRFAHLTEQGDHPATVVSSERGRYSRPGARAISGWRDPRTVRRAFVASLVFAPPKAFEN